ncbi:hypothetical protein Glove_311g66 [Diversispora epigaea]|uniref:HCP-like protein n=1 Tax=Diversispora epigaea TaxID=1348612 RepID=A0A397HXH4_9GLOM|nr:hypothetical protein Glove_311g66 [Diversispora epigaea]
MENEIEKKTFQLFMKSAEGGDHVDQNNLGDCYRNAFQWYMKSAEEENRTAQCNLGHCYNIIKGSELSKMKSKHFRGGSIQGQYKCNLRDCYRNGIGTIKDEKKAFECNGIGTTKDEKSYTWNQLKEEIMWVRIILEIVIAIETIKDEKKTFQLYMKSAEEENRTAQCNLGYCYNKGIGIIKDCYRNGVGTTKDEKEAFQWYMKSAEGGNSRVLKSAEEGNTDGQNKLGYCYLLAEGGNSDGQYSLANCYFYGIGTTKDKKKALMEKEFQ